MYFYWKTFFEHSWLIFHVVYPFSFFVVFFPFPYFAPKSVLPFFSSGCSHVFIDSPSTRCKKFPSLFWNYLYCSIFPRYLFRLPSFVNTFWLVSSSGIFRSTWRAFYTSSRYISVFSYLQFQPDFQSGFWFSLYFWSIKKSRFFPG